MRQSQIDIQNKDYYSTQSGDNTDQLLFLLYTEMPLIVIIKKHN
jgi:hypothetical protein